MKLACASIRRARPLLGTFVEITAAGAPRPVMEEAVEAAFAAIAKVHQLMSLQEPESDLCRLNHEASASPVEVDPWTFEVLQAALDLQRRSEGLFDVAVAPGTLSRTTPRHSHFCSSVAPAEAGVQARPVLGSGSLDPRFRRG